MCLCVTVLVLHFNFPHISTLKESIVINEKRKTHQPIKLKTFCWTENKRDNFMKIDFLGGKIDMLLRMLDRWLVIIIIQFHIKC